MVVDVNPGVQAVRCDGTGLKTSTKHPRNSSPKRLAKQLLPHRQCPKVYLLTVRSFLPGRLPCMNLSCACRRVSRLGLVRSEAAVHVWSGESPKLTRTPNPQTQYGAGFESRTVLTTHLSVLCKWARWWEHRLCQAASLCPSHDRSFVCDVQAFLNIHEEAALGFGFGHGGQRKCSSSNVGNDVQRPAVTAYVQCVRMLVTQLRETSKQM